MCGIWQGLKDPWLKGTLGMNASISKPNICKDLRLCSGTYGMLRRKKEMLVKFWKVLGRNF
jgi:hypothetical protein